MTDDVDRERLIEAIDALGLTPEEAASRLGAPLEMIEGVLAGRVTTIPRRFRDSATGLIDEGLNGVVVGFIPPDDPIELVLGDDATGSQTAEASAAPGDDAIEAPVATPKETSESPAAAEPDEALEPTQSPDEIKAAGSVEQEAALKAIKDAEAKEAAELKDFRKELLAECEKVEYADQSAADATMKRAIRGGIDERNGAQQIQATLRPRLKLTMAQMKAHWARCAEEIRAEDFIPPTAEELAALTQAGARKPRLEVQEGHPDRTVPALRDILAKSGRIFERGGAPVRIVYDKDSEGSVARQLTGHGLILEAHFVCQPWRFDPKVGEKDVDLPWSHAQMYLAWDGERNLLPLNGVMTAPLLSEDGSIRTTHGYDATTGLWCERVPDVGQFVPERPTRRQAEVSLMFVRDAFKTFCFADAKSIQAGEVALVDLSQPPGLDESSFLNSLLGSVCRPSLWLAPGSLFRGAQSSGSGAGKGLLVRCICEVAYGRQPSAVTAGADNEELEKRIAAALLEGGPAVLLDNFNNMTVISSSLDSALTERPSKVRQFGTSQSGRDQYRRLAVYHRQRRQSWARYGPAVHPDLF